MKLLIQFVVFIYTISFRLCLSAQEYSKSDSVAVNKKKLAVAITGQSVFYVGGISYLQYVWYKDVQRVPFHFYKDLKGYNQIDKFGHAYGAYVESYLSYYWLRSAGVSKHKALVYGGPMGLIMQTPIEVFDGVYEGWGFSVSDMVANALGPAFFISQELLFDDQLIKYKFSFSPSRYSGMANGYLGNSFAESLFYDYNGHTYWLSGSINHLIFKDKLPSWLCISAGYSAGGMFGEFENIKSYRGREIPETQRYRQFLLSMDIDWSKIPTQNKYLKKVLNSMFMIKTPFPAIEINTLGKVKGHWWYF